MIVDVILPDEGRYSVERKAIVPCHYCAERRVHVLPLQSIRGDIKYNALDLSCDAVI